MICYFTNVFIFSESDADSDMEDEYDSASGSEN